MRWAYPSATSACTLHKVSCAIVPASLEWAYIHRPALFAAHLPPIAESESSLSRWQAHCSFVWKVWQCRLGSQVMFACSPTIETGRRTLAECCLGPAGSATRFSTQVFCLHTFLPVQAPALICCSRQPGLCPARQAVQPAACGDAACCMWRCCLRRDFLMRAESPNSCAPEHQV